MTDEIMDRRRKGGEGKGGRQRKWKRRKGGEGKGGRQRK
jgi:hypothetical protein